MYIDFHTHGKLAKYLPFSTAYTEWLLGEAKGAGLDAICLTEHFNTLEFDTLYRYIAEIGIRDGDSFLCDGLRVFPGMETDIAEGGHVLCIGPMEAILELNSRLTPHKRRGTFLPAQTLFRWFSEYPVIVGAAHPYRCGGHIPELPETLLEKFDFLDLNGKDIAENRLQTQMLTYTLAKELGKPVVAGSDTHQAVQYGCIRTKFECSFCTVASLYEEMCAGRYSIYIDPEAALRVKTAGLLKRALKEIDALGGDYISVLLQDGGETAAVTAAKRMHMEA